ncbi:MAG: hypothetical protein ACE5I1_00265 [bacterium]
MQSQQPHDRRHLAWSIVSFIFGLSIVAVLVFQARPEYTALLIFGLSIIPTHILISPIAHEPIVFLYAKCFSPGLIAVTGGISCCVAGVFDYLALPKLIHHPAFRSRYENRPLYRKVQRLFCKSPFWFMTLASLTPLPHYPFKFLSIAGHYPLGKYTLAQLAGRIPRFYLLALFGYSMQFPAWVIVVILAVPIVFFLFNFISKKGDG